MEPHATATGLKILSAELKATRREIAELKTLLQLPPKRAP
jgi:ribosomal protein L29